MYAILYLMLISYFHDCLAKLGMSHFLSDYLYCHFAPHNFFGSTSVEIIFFIGIVF